MAWNIKILKKYLSQLGSFLLIVCETENRPCHCLKKYRSADCLSKSTVAACQIRDFTVSPPLAIAQIPKKEIIVFVFVWSVSPSSPREAKQNGFPFSIHRFPTISAGKKVSIPSPLPSPPFPPSCSVVLTAAAEETMVGSSLSLSSCGVCYLSLFFLAEEKGKERNHTHTLILSGSRAAAAEIRSLILAISHTRGRYKL